MWSLASVWWVGIYGIRFAEGRGKSNLSGLVDERSVHAARQKVVSAEARAAVQQAQGYTEHHGGAAGGAARRV
jgi:hypothetical protein